MRSNHMKKLIKVRVTPVANEAALQRLRVEFPSDLCAEAMGILEHPGAGRVCFVQVVGAATGRAYAMLHTHWVDRHGRKHGLIVTLIFQAASNAQAQEEAERYMLNIQLAPRPRRVLKSWREVQNWYARAAAGTGWAVEPVQPN
jgi:hypothetical protein